MKSTTCPRIHWPFSREYSGSWTRTLSDVSVMALGANPNCLLAAFIHFAGTSGLFWASPDIGKTPEANRHNDTNKDNLLKGHVTISDLLLFYCFIARGKSFADNRHAFIN